MRIEQMFPSPYLQAEDLRAYNNGITVVTIDEVTYKTKEARNVGEAEIDYFLKLRELRKPMRLKKINADSIAELLGTRETDDWRGQTIGIFPVQVRVPDPQGGTKPVWVINVDIVKPTTAPQLSPNSDITGMAHESTVRGPALTGMGNRPRPVGSQAAQPGSALTTAGGNAPIGADKAIEIVDALHQRGKVWGDLEQHLRIAGQQDLVSGKLPPDAAAAVVPLARVFVRDMPKTRPAMTAAEKTAVRNAWAPPPPATEVLDRTTGEVITPGSVPPDDDIPF